MTDDRTQDEAEAQAQAAQEEAARERREQEAADEKAQFDMDPSLAEAMKAAEASYERLAREGRGEDEDEIELEIEGSAPTAGAGEGVIRALAEMRKARDELEVAEGKVKDLEERLMRTAADFENYKKRMLREREEERKYAVEGLLKDLLPVLDNLERALAAAVEHGESSVATGVQMVYKQFLDTLTRHGVEQLSALGEKFDPNFHEAMQQVESADHPPGTVVTEYMKGYTLKGRLVRPAMVVVSTAPAAPGASEGEAQGSGPGADEQGGSET